MTDYHDLSADDQYLIDAKIARNMAAQRATPNGFGSDPALAADSERIFRENGREYFSQPENLERLRENHRLWLERNPGMTPSDWDEIKSKKWPELEHDAPAFRM